MIKQQFSYSRLKNWLSCPKRTYNYDLAPWDERIKDAPGEALTEGIRIHDAMAKALEGKQELPPDMQEYQVYIDQVLGGAPGKILVEKNYAFDRNFNACMYKSHSVFWRCKIDVIKLGERGAVVLDWKSGARKVEEDQLFLSAQAIFAHHPEIELVSASFVWLNEKPDDAFTTVDYKRVDMAKGWARLMPTINAMIKAYETEDFPAKPGGLCKSYCGVLSCPYHGRGSR